MIKNYLVTGGTGFIGTAVVENLSRLKNTKIIVYDNNSRISRIKSSNKFKNVIYINGDIRNRNKLNSVFKKYRINTIVHLAYINGTRFFYEKPCEIIDVAARGMQNVIELGIRYKTPNFFLASSSEVYHEPKIIPTPENIDLKIPNIFNPRFSYGGGKIFCELMAANYGKNNIRINCVSPGGISNSKVLVDKKSYKLFEKNYKKRVPMKRFAKSEEISGPIIFLASEASSYITGINLLVDGGWTSI